ncbi:MAG: glycosyltransferase family 4 protein [Bacteroidota bacterium]
MKLAYYYHIPIRADKGTLYMPGFLAVFIDSLANEVDELILIMHECNAKEELEADCELVNKNIRWINLGVKTPSWHRALFHNKILKSVSKELNSGCDAIIVRSPTPLAPYFKRYFRNIKVLFMVVGDYAEGASHLHIKSIRDLAIQYYLQLNDWLFRREMKTTDILVNSPGLYRKYLPISKSINLIKTTTLSKKDIITRLDTCQAEVIQILYTGRIDPAKGLFELIDACAKLKNSNVAIQLNIVGWEQDPDKSVEGALIKHGEKLGINENIIFHGRKKVGPELNSYYRNADIYVIPSYHEGFPRTIWEAMANGLPVIATRVGGIPEYLEHLKDVILIEPKSSDEIYNAILMLIKDSQLRKEIIFHAREKVFENTLEIQSSRLIQIVQSCLEDNLKGN